MENPTTLQTSQLDYQIIGHHIPLLELMLSPGQTIIAQSGTMNYLDPGIGFKAHMGDGVSIQQGWRSRLASASRRAVSGEALFMTHFTNHVDVPRTVALAAPHPGTILALDLKQYQGELFCQKDSFLAGGEKIAIGIKLHQNFSVGLLGGEGFVLQHITGEDLVFLHAGGTLVQKTLNNDSLYIDTGCLVAFSQGLVYEIEKSANIKNAWLSGEGRYLAKLTGSGTVFIQSLPFAKLANQICQAAEPPGFFGRFFGRWFGGS